MPMIHTVQPISYKPTDIKVDLFLPFRYATPMQLYLVSSRNAISSMVQCVLDHDSAVHITSTPKG